MQTQVRPSFVTRDDVFCTFFGFHFIFHKSPYLDSVDSTLTFDFR